MRAMSLQSAAVLMVLGLVLIALPLDAQETVPEDAPSTQKAGGVKSLEKRIQKLEEAIGRDVVSNEWYNRIQISGLIEVEAAFRDFEDKNDPSADTQESDVDLANLAAELRKSVADFKLPV